MSTRGLLRQLEHILARAGAPPLEGGPRRRGRRGARAPWLPLLSSAALASGCYRWVPLRPQELTQERVTDAVLRVTLEPERVELSRPRVEGGYLYGTLERVERLGLGASQQQASGPYFSREVLSLSQVERREVNGGAVAGIVTASVLGAGLLGVGIAAIAFSAGGGLGGGFGGFGGLGRRPEGLVTEHQTACDGSLGAYFARCAELEAASAPAFQRLARELEAFDAPSALVRAAKRSAHEELRHAELMASLAARFGRVPGPVEVREHTPRSLQAFAEENAVEGCVNESWGAVLAHWQARASTDPAVRGVLSSVACDETSHAVLARRVHDWALARLGPAGRAELTRAREAAVEALGGEPLPPLREAVRPIAGLPDAAEARSLLGAARELLLGTA